MRHIHRKNKKQLTLEEETTLDHIIFGFAGISLFITLLSGTILLSSNFNTHADNTTSTNVAVSVANYCTLGGTVTSAHSATLVGGSYTTGIGSTILTAYCNDPGGFVIYAIGAGDGADPTEMVSSISSDHNIITGLNTDIDPGDGKSNWAMRIDPVLNEYTPVINSDYDSKYGLVPSNYTSVVTKTSGTDVPYGSIGAVGAKVTTTYSAYIASAQPAGTYTGKVKYAMIHPHTNQTIQTLEQSLAKAEIPKVGGYYPMQSLNSTICNETTIIGTDSILQMIDTRDNQLYYVTKLQDGNCWMLDNLRLDLTNNDVKTAMYNSTDTKTNASYETLGYLFNGGGTSPYPTASVVNGTDNTTWVNSYNNPYINNAYADTTATNYGNGSGKIGIYYNYCAASAGSYCYAGGYGTGDAGEDICPSNWHIPTGGSNGEYQHLFDQYNVTQTATNVNSLQYNLSASLSGGFYDGILHNQNSTGYFWSSTRNGAYYMYRLDTDIFGAYPQSYSNRDRGFSVRCMLRSS